MNYRFTLVWKTIVVSVLAIAAFMVLSLACNFLTMGIAKAIGVPDSWLEYPIFLTLFIALMLLPKRFFKLNFPLVFKRSAIIDAPISQIWNEINPKTRDDYYLAAVARFEADAHNDRRFTMFMDDALSQTKDEGPITVKIEVQERRKHAYVNYVYHHDDETHERVKIATQSERILEKAQQGVRVTLIEHVHGISLFTALAFLIIHPCQDALKQLKARCEGVPNTSWANKMMREVKVAANGGPEISNSDAGLVMTTAVCTLIAATIALVWFMKVFVAT